MNSWLTIRFYGSVTRAHDNSISVKVAEHYARFTYLSQPVLIPVLIIEHAKFLVFSNNVFETTTKHISQFRILLSRLDAAHTFRRSSHFYLL